MNIHIAIDRTQIIVTCVTYDFPTEDDNNMPLKSIKLPIGLIAEILNETIYN